MSQASTLTRKIISFLFSQGIYAWRQNVTPIPLPSGQFRPAAKVGVSDILAVLPPTGCLLAIETKIGKDRLRPEQEGFLKNVEAMGGLTMIVSSYDDFLVQFKKINLSYLIVRKPK